jgi:hypothetical protein
MCALRPLGGSFWQRAARLDRGHGRGYGGQYSHGLYLHPVQEETVMTKPNPSRAGECCGQPVKQGHDLLHAQLWGHVVLCHWSCFLRRMRASDQADVRSAREAETMTDAAPEELMRWRRLAIDPWMQEAERKWQ